ncbi:MAG: type II toxin-antitoxin system PemK/MazF family toxin [Planctomycetes bacterium]|nr:type II toxin-antitoxin system PemK/MazF family toxin [Planctomycetota bacterium]
MSCIAESVLCLAATTLSISARATSSRIGPPKKPGATRTTRPTTTTTPTARSDGRPPRRHIVLLAMPFAQGGGSKIRPALVVQADRNNARLTNTIVAAITRNTARVREPTQFLIDVATPAGQQSGLLATSAITCENLFTVSQQFIRRNIGRLPPHVLQQVDLCLKTALASREGRLLPLTRSTPLPRSRGRP